MLENFIFSCNAVIPIFVLIAFGYFLKQKDYIDETITKKLNNIVFNFTLPAMLFLNTATSKVADNFDFFFFLWLASFTFFAFLFSWLIGEIFIKDKSRIGAFVQGSFRGNYAILGLSVINNILGDNNTGKGLIVTVIILPIYNVLSIIALSARNKDTKNDSSVLKTALINIAKNPLIISILLSLPFSIFSIKLPVVVSSSLKSLGSLTMPLALICIGGNINLKTSFKDIKFAVLATFLKNVFFPVTAVLLGALAFNLRGEELLITFVLTATPTAVASYVMSANMNSDPKLASNIILFTTLFSLFSFTIGIYLLKTLNLI